MSVKIKSSGTLSFAPNNTTNITLDTEGNLLYSPTGFVIKSNTLDADDTKSIQICGGGAVSLNRGGYISVDGNEFPTYGGTISLTTGDVATGNIFLIVSNSSG